ncbi:MAG: hypothetical protein GY765_12930, partial [bacterium]|nr:hypothetical protein [bacterium]
MDTLLKMIIAFLGFVIVASVFSPDHSTHYELTGRTAGIYKNPNTLGLMAMQTFFLIIYWWRKSMGKPLSKWIFAFAILVAAALVMSGSRAAILGILVGLFVYFACYSRVYKRVLSNMTIVAMLGLVSIVVVWM